ncbi:hypothetical protein ATANTOWER_001247 [Ataeniobius toweri]|uniref:Uncharacterized protein n=1 Tax=Ataeniobius toweri TaxID=208326 RepID=A0ABU7B419_9TELE|nr:hypothetical protein [Ataeniobius toweri]
MHLCMCTTFQHHQPKHYQRSWWITSFLTDQQKQRRLWSILSHTRTISTSDPQGFLALDRSRTHPSAHQR